MMKQKEIVKILGINQSDVSRIGSGERQISWPLALRMSKLFPYRDVVGWKTATPEQFRQAFNETTYGVLLENLKKIKRGQ